MKRHVRALSSLAILSFMPFVTAEAAADLGGSMSSMRRQYAIARQHDYTFLRTPDQVRDFVRKDRLEPLVTNANLVVHRVSYPYARPEVKLFIERLAEQYREATGERLVVTSLTRPLTRQPRNAHHLSVHPAGMAVDLRIPKDRKARQWLESVLLQLESRGVLDATRERRPPHYHVAVYPTRYSGYVERLLEREQRHAGNNGAASSSDAEYADEELVVASLEPEDDLAIESDSVAAEETVAEEAQSAGMPAFPIIALISLTGVTAAGMRIARRLRKDEDDLT